MRSRVPLLDLEVAEWERVLRINLTGTFLGIRTAARQWVRNGTPGAIVNMASVNAFSAVEGQPHYVASKAAIAVLTKAAALELAPHDIRVNAVAPGPIETPMLGQRLDEPGQREWLEQQVPMGRLGQPSDVAEAVEFLLSARASYVTGITMPVDGGWLTK